MPVDDPPRIRVLSDHVCNKIAAGEVIERPASVFKELVENAVDAGASDITVEVLRGGRAAVMITDNGCGMNRDACLLAVERHATSKIRDVDDIEHIHTMGFRGEALAAISSVSRFILESRPPEALAGTRIRIDGGKLADVEEAGCPPGTRIEVRNLFFNVPARRKFLRTEATELAYIRTLFHTFALAHPDVALRMKVDGREMDRFPPQAHLADRIADLHGRDVLDQLRPVDLRDRDLHIHGFAGLPSLHRSDRRDQVTLINRRPASAPVLGYAIREAYADTLPRGRHPVVFLHVDIPPDWVDVNVHPTKREVRFGPSHRIRDALIQALTSAFAPRDAAPPSPSPAPRAAEPPHTDPARRQESLPGPEPAYPPLPPASPPPATPPPAESLPKSGRPPLSPSASTSPSQTPAPPSPAGPEHWPEAEYLGPLSSFHLLSLDRGLIVLYPRAARERIFYEDACRQWDAETPRSQRLLFPETVEASPEEARRIREQLDALRRLGFALEEFGGGSFLVEALPSWMENGCAGDLLTSLARDALSGSGRNPAMTELRERLARSGCRLAAARSAPLSAESCRTLLKRLSQCDMPYTTPFGRPTLLHMGVEEFSRKFGIG